MTVQRAERLALHGLGVGAWQRFSDQGFKHYEGVEPGFKLNMTDVSERTLSLPLSPKVTAEDQADVAALGAILGSRG